MWSGAALPEAVYSGAIARKTLQPAAAETRGLFEQDAGLANLAGQGDGLAAQASGGSPRRAKGCRAATPDNRVPRVTA